MRCENVLETNNLDLNYANPPIPERYKHVCGEWNNGFVIEKEIGRNQFVWIPVGSLDSNGTLDGVNFSEKFGRRNYRNDKFSDEEYHESLEGELFQQFESVKKYGGFYISRYNIDKYGDSKKDVEPVLQTYHEAKEMASFMEYRLELSSHLTFGAEYDCVLEWLIESKSKSLMKIATGSRTWGNYFDTSESPEKLVKTGSSEKWCANNIYDLAGNVSEWTQECYGKEPVERGGGYSCSGIYWPVARRYHGGANYQSYKTGFRSVLYIK